MTVIELKIREREGTPPEIMSFQGMRMSEVLPRVVAYIRAKYGIIEVDTEEEVEIVW